MHECSIKTPRKCFFEFYNAQMMLILEKENKLMAAAESKLKASYCLITHAILIYENGVFSWWKHTFQGHIMDLSFNKKILSYEFVQYHLICKQSISLHILLFPFYLWRTVMTFLSRTETLCEQHNKRKDETFSITKWPTTNCSIVPNIGKKWIKWKVLCSKWQLYITSCSFPPLSALKGENRQSGIN